MISVVNEAGEGLVGGLVASRGVLLYCVTGGLERLGTPLGGK